MYPCPYEPTLTKGAQEIRNHLSDEWMMTLFLCPTYFAMFASPENRSINATLISNGQPCVNRMYPCPYEPTLTKGAQGVRYGFSDEWINLFIFALYFALFGSSENQWINKMPISDRQPCANQRSCAYRSTANKYVLTIRLLWISRGQSCTYRTDCTDPLCSDIDVFAIGRGHITTCAGRTFCMDYCSVLHKHPRMARV